MPYNPLIRVVELEAEAGERWGFDLATVKISEGQNHPSSQYFSSIVPQSPAYRAQCLQNDYLLKINDVDVTHMKHNAVVDAVKSVSSNRLTLTIQSSAFETMAIPHKMYKIREGNVYPRTFWLSDDHSRIYWKSKQKDKSEAVYRLGDIKEIRLGRESISFQRAYEDASEKVRLLMGGDRAAGCFSIVVGQDYEVIDFVAPNYTTYTVWTLALQHFTATGKELIEEDAKGRAHARNQWLRSVFDEGDINSDKALSLNEARILMKKLNFHIDHSLLKRKFFEADSDRKGSEGHAQLDFDEFKKFYKLIATRADVGAVALKYGEGSVDRSRTQNKFDTFDDVVLSAENLKLFLEIEQVEPGVTVESCQAVIDEFEPIEERRKEGLLGIDGFTRFLMSNYGDAFDPTCVRTVYQDMTQPLPSYYIASSHNTYLAEDQLRGPSDAEMYMKALMMGCRCVELDCWSGPDGDPIIYHGYTLTSKISFREVIGIIKTYAFKVSDYPVILSLENHCDVEQQKKMAKYLTTILGDMLYTDFNPDEPFPSPEALKGRILIKGKKLKPNNETGEVSDEDEADNVVSDPLILKGQSKIVKKKFRKQVNEKARNGGSKKKKKKLAQELSDLVTWVTSVHFHGFEHDPRLLPANEMSSFGENKARELCLDRVTGAQFVERNKRQLARTYPAGIRVNSSNYEPHEMWNAGCQLVALNYQTHCHEMCLNQGKFRDNGGSGYILKPEPLRVFGMDFNPNDPSLLPVKNGKVLSITCISGQHLPKPRSARAGEVVDPYVRVELVGIPADCAKAQTSVVVNNGFNPQWNETVEFDVRFPDLALVHFKVYDEDALSGDDFMAQCVVPFHALRQGYRHVELRSKSDARLPNVTLFIHVAVLPGGSRSLREGARDAMKIVSKTDLKNLQRQLKFPQLERAFAQAPILKSSQLREALLLGLERFKDSLGLPVSAAFDASMEVLLKRIASGGGSLMAEEAVAGDVKTYTLVTSGLDVAQISSTKIGRPLQHYDNIRHACEQIQTATGSLLKKFYECIEEFEQFESDGQFGALCAKAQISKKKTRKKQRDTFDAKLNEIRKHSGECESALAVSQEIYESVARIVIEKAGPRRKTPAQIVPEAALSGEVQSVPLSNTQAEDEDDDEEGV